MTDDVRENSGREHDGRFRPGQSGNLAGKPKGTRHRATEMVETLMAGDAEAIARAVIEKAREGDMMAARIVLDRIAPARKGRAVSFTLPPVTNAGDLAMANAAVLAALSAGEITTDEATDVSKVLDLMGGAFERRDLEARIAALEAEVKS